MKIESIVISVTKIAMQTRLIIVNVKSALAGKAICLTSSAKSTYSVTKARNRVTGSPS